MKAGVWTMSEGSEPGRPDRDPTDWDSRNPVDREEGTGHDEGNAIQFSWWNLLLLIPLLMLITSFYNSETPWLFGMPYFYWFQFAFVFVGVACVGIVFVTTKNRRHPSAIRSAEPNGNDDSGTRR